MFGMAERHHHRLMSWKLNFAIPRSSHNELTRLRSSTTTQLVNTSPWIHSKQARKGFSVRVKKRLDEEERKSMSWEPGIPCGVLERFIFEFTRHDVDFRWLMYVYVDFLTDEIVFSNGWLWKDGCGRMVVEGSHRLIHFELSIVVLYLTMMTDHDWGLPFLLALCSGYRHGWLKPLLVKTQLA